MSHTDNNDSNFSLFHVNELLQRLAKTILDMEMKKKNMEIDLGIIK